MLSIIVLVSMNLCEGMDIIKINEAGEKNSGSLEKKIT